MTAAAVQERFPAVQWACPALPASPKQAMDAVLALADNWPKDSTAIIGSSLGGFYATWLAELWGCKAALLNPAVHPARDLAAHMGTQTVWQDPTQNFVFEATYIDELRAQEVAHISHPERYFAVIAKGDEVLDWREMTRHYAGATIKLLPAGDHALSDYEQHLDAVLDFLQLLPA